MAWFYDNKLCEILPDPSCRLNMVKELLQRGFFIKNQPEESELVLGHAEATTTAPVSSTKDWQNVLRAGKAEFLRIFKNLQTGFVVSGSAKVLYRYYCEAILLYRHHQSPGTVKGFTVSYSVLVNQHLWYAVIYFALWNDIISMFSRMQSGWAGFIMGAGFWQAFTDTVKEASRQRHLPWQSKRKQ